MSAQTQSRTFEKSKTTDTGDKTSNPVRKDGDIEPGISTGSMQDQSSEIEKNKSIDT